MLCDRCQYAVQQAADFEGSHPDELRTGPHHLTSASLKQALDGGCYACNLLWKRLSQGQSGSPPRDLPDSTEYVLYPNEFSPEAYDLRLGPPDSTGEENRLHGQNFATPPRRLRENKWFKLYFATDNNPPSDHAKILPATWSGGSISLAKRWISNCLNFHHCSRPPGTDNPSWYPTRLLSFTSHRPSLESSNIRLIETKDAVPINGYTTLSHCWGQGVHFTLNKQTHAALAAGHPLTSLPRLFQDAIQVSCDLGITHIWIDSLCIFQDADDKSDWEREASLMQKVYSNSYCNISALHCGHSSESMFGVRDPTMLPPPVFEANVSDEVKPRLIDAIYKVWESRAPWSNQNSTKQEGVAVTSALSWEETESSITSFKYILADLMWDDVDKGLLNTRAWVFQERLLSPRILHFGASQVFWECCRASASEVYPDGFPENIEPVRYKSNQPSQPIVRKKKSRDIDSDLATIQEMNYWADIVTNYTACNLTFGSDKLIALSGVASLARDLMGGDEYLAGLWRRGLGSQLLWWADSLVARPGEYRAPSWSWAAVDGPISPNQYGYMDRDKLLITVDAVDVRCSTENLTGSVSDGWLRLRGLLKRVRLMRRPGQAGWSVVLGDLVVEEDRSREIMLWTTVLFDSKNGDDDDEWEREECTLFCMIASDFEDLSARVLLFQAVDANAGIFRRVGLALIWDQMFRRGLREKSREDKGVPCVQYMDGLHLICIV
ncbi:heterokaryon incompatibility protein-domain-containing protein [Cercophora scortea]|uniref:Heterokaryon incompatibility protein-domain-containing protein n=1 Tax=Cercophora scortea TaxID=314031 RepID=A0AAE0I3B9_9PEZI|nr:heterokaryon incompatibility protein-domain-containing protein [Cercophora scortea]